MSFPLINMSVTQGYGPRIHPITGLPDFHNGDDLKAVYKDAYATDDGVVRLAHDTGYPIGLYLVIDHNGYTSIFGHMRDIFVVPGQTIRKGDCIGVTGNSGGSTGPHLHFEIRVGNPVNLWDRDHNGKYATSVDPIPFLKGTEHWAEKYFNYLNNEGITISEKRYDDNITRGEVFALLARMEGFEK